MLVTALGKEQGRISKEKEKEIVEALHALPKQINAALSFEKEIEALATDFADKHHTLFQTERDLLHPRRSVRGG